MTGLTEDAARQLTAIIKGGVNNDMELLEWAVRQDIPKKVGMSTDDWVDREIGGYVRRKAIDRRQVVPELVEKGFSNVQIGEILGVDEGTVRNDRKAIASENSEVEDLSTQVDTDDVSENSEVDLPLPDLEVTEPAAPGWHQLGPHQLYCGDSTNPEFIDRCAGAGFAFADPPYNAGKAEWDNDFKWHHDYLTDQAAIVAVTPGIASLADFLTTTTMPYQWSIAAEITNGMTRGALGFGNWIAVTLFANGSIYRRSKDILRMPAATGDDTGHRHPSRKPIRLLTALIGLFSTKGDTVADPFLGAGTTLMAAELTDRRCVGAEIDPLYCAEIIARYDNLTATT